MITLIKRSRIRAWIQDVMQLYRWQLAYTMDTFRDTCWAELVLWALSPEFHPWYDILQMRRTAGACARSGDTPYCGKCELTGIHRELGGPFTFEESRRRHSARERSDVSWTIQTTHIPTADAP